MGGCKRAFAVGAFVVSIVISASAPAQIVTIQHRGVITGISALNNGTSVPAPTGKIALGDSYQFTMSFDRNQAELQSLFNADPTVNIYYLPGTSYSFTSNTYSFSYTVPNSGGASAQLWNNRTDGGMQPTDSQSFSVYSFNTPAGAVPFDLGAGQQTLGLNSNSFDFTATARNSDLISELAQPTSFANKTFDINQLNADTNYFVSVSGSVVESTLAIAAAPEPGSWALMILGFGIVGYAMRRRQRVTFCGNAAIAQLGS